MVASSSSSGTITSRGEYVGVVVGTYNEPTGIVPSEGMELGPIDVVGGEVIGSDVIICMEFEGVGSNVTSMTGNVLGSDVVTSSNGGSGWGVVTSSTGGSINARYGLGSAVSTSSTDGPGVAR
jgi:hypothetical protein